MATRVSGGNSTLIWLTLLLHRDVNLPLAVSIARAAFDVILGTRQSNSTSNHDVDDKATLLMLFGYPRERSQWWWLLEVLFSSRTLSLPQNEKKMRNLHDMQDGVWAARIAYSAMSGVSRLWITSRSMEKYARKWIWHVNAHRRSRYAGWVLQFSWRPASAAIKAELSAAFSLLTSRAYIFTQFVKEKSHETLILDAISLIRRRNRENIYREAASSVNKQWNIIMRCLRHRLSRKVYWIVRGDAEYCMQMRSLG